MNNSAAPVETPAPVAATPRWEYATVPVVAAGFEDAAGVENYHAIMNEYGGQGWELVGTASYPGQAVGGWVVVFSFKRPVVSNSSPAVSAG